jgi:hypothetical protein
MLWEEHIDYPSINNPCYVGKSNLLSARHVTNQHASLVEGSTGCDQLDEEQPTLS